MTQTYRTDDLARWGTGQGFNLTPAQVDINFWDLVQRMIAQEARPDAAAGIDHFEIVGINMFVHMTDATVLGPYELPVATFQDRGVWTPETVYSKMDTFSINGGLYVVTFPHTSALTFDAGANDGAGHDYYQLMIQTPGSAMPSGGAVGQVVTKSTTTDYAVAWSYKTATGGATGEVLLKNSATQDDTVWGSVDAADVSFTPGTGSTISSTNVADALEEVASSGGGDAIDIAYTPPSGSSLTATNVQDAIDELEASGGGGGVGLQTIWVPATAMVPQTTNGPAAGLVEMATNKTMVASLDYDKTTREDAQFSIAMPKSWDKGTIDFRVFWSHATGGTVFGVVIGLQAMAISDSSALDAVWGSSIVVVDTGGTANMLYVTPSDTITVGLTPSDGDLIYFRLYRSPTSSSDTLDVDCRIHGLQLFYTASAGTDD